MPAYDYRCTACSTRFEVIRKVGDNDEVMCPECGSETKRVFTPVGVVFKGSGFHNTDYRTKPAEEKPAAPAPCEADKSATGACASCPATAE